MNHKETAIEVKQVYKSFKLPHQKTKSVKGLFVNIFRGRRTYEKQEVLKNVSLEIKKGEFFGIIGRNGSGKSTLLKLLAGIYAPDEGHIKINGKLVPFIELGVGFNPELTGRENVFLNGALLGFGTSEMEAMYDEIVEFAELERFMDQQLKNYSSGMQVRLAFSIAIRAKADILLIDEVLAVGDTNFQSKCIEVFEQLKHEGRTIIFVSHSMEYVKQFCDRVAVIANGKLVYAGETPKGVDIYNKLNFDDETVRTEAQNLEKFNKFERLGNGNAEITAYRCINHLGKETISLSAGEKFTFELDVKFHKAATNPAVGIMFKKNPNENLFGINNFYEDVKFGKQRAGDNITVIAEGTMPLAPGTYFVSLSVADARTVSDYAELDTLNNIMKVNVEGKIRWGLLTAETNMRVK